MEKITVPYRSQGGQVPVYQSEAASGADVISSNAEEIVIKPGSRVLIPTGLYLEIPTGYEAQVRPRSGLAARYGVTVLNAPGTIDADYRGEVRVILINHGQEDFIVRKGDRIAQLVFAPVFKVQFQPVEALKSSRRGEGGFGSTGLSSVT